MKRSISLFALLWFSTLVSGCYTQILTYEPVVRPAQGSVDSSGNPIPTDQEIPMYDDEDYAAGYHEGFYEGSLFYKDYSYQPQWANYYDPFDFYVPSYYHSPSWSIGMNWNRPWGGFGIYSYYYWDSYPYFNPYNFYGYNVGYSPWYYDWYYSGGWYPWRVPTVVFVDPDREYRSGRRGSGVDRSQSGYGDNSGSRTGTTSRRNEGYGTGVYRSPSGTVGKTTADDRGRSRTSGTVGRSSGTTRSNSGGTVRSSGSTRTNDGSGVRSSGSSRGSSSGSVRSESKPSGSSSSGSSRGTSSGSVRTESKPSSSSSSGSSRSSSSGSVGKSSSSSSSSSSGSSSGSRSSSSSSGSSRSSSTKRGGN